MEHYSESARKRQAGKLAILVIFTLVTITATLSGLATAQSDLYDGGSGTESDPYKIDNWTHLDNVRQNLNDNFTLVSDLNETTEGYNSFVSGGEGFKPIGNSSTPFNGTFNGSGHKISDLMINRPDEANISLFSVIGLDGKVTLVGVENANVTGGVSVGGLVGYNAGSVKLSYTTGSVKGDTSRGQSGSSVGGLVGNLTGDIRNSYSISNVSGTTNVGGLVGNNNGSNAVVNQSYSAGDVSGDSNVGGLIGMKENDATVEDAYWDVNTTNQKSSDGGTALTTDQMKGDAAKTNISGFDFNSFWGAVSSSNISYPYLLNNQQNPAPGLQSLTSGSAIYVDASAAGNNPVGSKSNPYKTIQAGIDNADSGDTIIVETGTYDESVIIDKTVHINAENYVILDGSNIDGFGFEIITNNTTVTGFTVKNYTAGIEARNVSNITITDTTIINSDSQGIAFDNVTNSTIQESTILRSNLEGLLLMKADNNTIQHNRIMNNLQNTSASKDRQFTLENISTTTDLIIVIDDSGSMSTDDVSGASSRMEAAKEAAKNAVGQLRDNDRVSVIGMTPVEIKINLTDNHTAVNKSIDSMTASGSADMAGGIDKSNTELTNNARQSSN